MSGSGIQGILGFSDSGFSDTWIWRIMDSEILGVMGSWIMGPMGSGIQRPIDSAIRGTWVLIDSGVHGFGASGIR